MKQAKGFAQLGVLIIVGVLVLGGTYLYAVNKPASDNLNKGSSQTNSIGNNASNSGSNNVSVQVKNIEPQELSSYFNSFLPQCSTCFDSSFKSKNPSGGTYDDPLFELVDFTGDGKLDALVTILESGTGGFKDFYSLTYSGGEMVMLQKVEGFGFYRSQDKPYFGKNTITLREPSPLSNPNPKIIELKWDAVSRKFIPLDSN